MRFMIIRKADKDTEGLVKPSTEILAAINQYMEEMAKAGVVLGGEGLRPSAEGFRVNFANGKPRVIDGPFTEVKELIAGYFLIQVKSKAEAIEWAKRWPALDANGNLELEIRPLFEAEDFGEEFTPELREAENRLRAEIERKH
ncbi:YciI family protein [Hypericibacter sp.]|uniref:YciI family protein n=1 Tax=Hypericibacter sp. TaxID=2705401 RepID=UPI003D6D9D54